MAKDEEKTSQANSTNALLALILDEAKSTNKKLDLMIVGLQSVPASMAAQLAATLKGNDYLQQIANSISGEMHNFSVKIEQLTKKLGG